MIRHSKEILEELIKSSRTWSDVCRKLGLNPLSGSQHHIKKRAVFFGIDYSHFAGSNHHLGKILGPKRKIEVYLNNEKPIHSNTLKKRLIKEGYKEAKCERCKLTEWEGEPIPLELDHISSDHDDNRLENLQIVCPNCHALFTRERGRRKQPIMPL